MSPASCRSKRVDDHSRFYANFRDFRGAQCRRPQAFLRKPVSTTTVVSLLDVIMDLLLDLIIRAMPFFRMCVHRSVQGLNTVCHASLASELGLSRLASEPRLRPVGPMPAKACEPCAPWSHRSSRLARRWLLDPSFRPGARPPLDHNSIPNAFPVASEQLRGMRTRRRENSEHHSGRHCVAS